MNLIQDENPTTTELKMMIVERQLGRTPEQISARRKEQQEYENKGQLFYVFGNNP